MVTLFEIIKIYIMQYFWLNFEFCDTRNLLSDMKQGSIYSAFNDSSFDRFISKS